MGTVSNQDLLLAFDFVKYTNRNILLTGKAGTGKTTFLHDLKKSSPKRMIVVAPTGVAAINAGGYTIHSFFQLPFHPYVPSFYLPQNHPGNPAGQKDPAGFKMNLEKINIIKNLDLFMIGDLQRLAPVVRCPDDDFSIRVEMAEWAKKAYQWMLLTELIASQFMRIDDLKM